MFTKLMTIISILASLSCPIQDQGIYTRCMEVTNVNYDTEIVQCIDSVGFEWEFTGCEDYVEGDLVTCIMATNGTDDTILDDTIIETQYSGYTVVH